jgi:hypothetical protein
LWTLRRSPRRASRIRENRFTRRVGQCASGGNIEALLEEVGALRVEVDALRMEIRELTASVEAAVAWVVEWTGEAAGGV